MRVGVGVMQHPSVDVAQRPYAAYGQEEGDAISASLVSDVVWHSSGSYESSGTFRGADSVLGHLFGGAPMDVYDLQVIDIPVSGQRVAAVARSRMRRGEHEFTGDFAQVLTITAGRVGEVWNDKWDQQAAAEFSALTTGVRR